MLLFKDAVDNYIYGFILAQVLSDLASTFLYSPSLSNHTHTLVKWSQLPQNDLYTSMAIPFHGYLSQRVKTCIQLKEFWNN